MFRAQSGRDLSRTVQGSARRRQSPDGTRQTLCRLRQDLQPLQKSAISRVLRMYRSDYRCASGAGETIRLLAYFAATPEGDQRSEVRRDHGSQQQMPRWRQLLLISHKMNRFAQKLTEHSVLLRRARPETLQVNLGKLCNLTCAHCHVNAGPKRREIMSRETMDRIIDWLTKTEIP